jgi:putative peptidoglycan lipid II flippase
VKLGNPQSLARASALMSGGTVLSRATGMVRLIAITAALGIAESRLADAYNLANTVPNLIYQLILGGILGSVFVPVIVELMETEEQDKAWEAISAIINLSVVILAAVTVLGILAAPWIAGFYAARLEGGQAELQRQVMTFLVRLFAPQILFYGLAAITASLMNAHKRFGAPMYTPVLNNLVVIFVFVAFHRLFGREGLGTGSAQLWLIGLGTTLGVVMMALAQLPFLRGLGPYRWTLLPSHPSVRKVARLSVFVVGFVVASQIGFLLVQWLANAQQGGYSAYFTAFTFYLLPISLFGLSVMTALLPDMSRHAVNQSWGEFRERLSLGIRTTNFLLLPAAVGYFILGHAILGIVLENGVMTAQSVDLVTEVLQLFVLGLPQAAIFFLFVRAFYAMQDTKSPFLIVCLIVVLNAVINFPLFAWFEVAGLALGQAVANTVAIVLAGWSLSSRIHGIDGHRVANSGLRIAVAAGGMGAVIFIGDRVTAGLVQGSNLPGELAILGFLVALGVASYLLFARLVKVEELAYVRRLLVRSDAAASTDSSVGGGPLA